MKSTDYMEWVCDGCGRQYPQSILVCEKCVKSKSENAKLVPPKHFELIQKYEKMEPLPVLKRFFSLKGRIGRIEFFFGIIISFLLIYILGFIFHFLQIEYGKYIAQFVGFIIIFIFASKRSRDLDLNPWLGIPLVIITLSLFFLLFGSGTKGANRYGPAITKQT